MSSENDREVFMALIAPIGIGLEMVQTELAEALRRVHYDTNVIHLTNILRERGLVEPKYETGVDRARAYIAAGDDLCLNTKANNIFALYGVSKVSGSGKIAHVFRQVKRLAEIETLKEVYGRNILFLGCYAPKDQRVQSLVSEMIQTRRHDSRTLLEANALEIMSIDEEERDKPHGQRFAECYPYSDYIIDCSSKAACKESCERFVEIYFGSHFVSPTIDEYASYIANAASYRSLDLSRQVGAAIFSKERQVISLGCNEVPKAGGGTYWSDCEHDHRDYSLGIDSNQKVREDLVRDTILRIKDANWLTEEIAAKDISELTRESFSKATEVNDSGPLHGSMIADVIEYGRMVHAEMNALADAARFGKSTAGATLYCTTMPCHMCTKLIVAAGISRVVYLQPYGKSLVRELYADSVDLDDQGVPGKVRYETLKGVTPNGFRMAFRKAHKRKDGDGKALKWIASEGKPTFVSLYPYFEETQKRAKADFIEAISKLDLKVDGSDVAGQTG